MGVLMNHSQKTKAGIKLTKILKTIMAEETEVYTDEDCCPVMITKAEKMIRTMVAIALGLSYMEIDDKGIETTKHHPPDRRMMEVIFDRTDGRAIPVPAEANRDLSVSERVDEQARRRINNAGDDREP